MSSAQQILTLDRPVVRPWRVALPSPDVCWAVAFATPYAAVFLAFVLYPVVYGLWLGSSPARLQ